MNIQMVEKIFTPDRKITGYITLFVTEVKTPLTNLKFFHASGFTTALLSQNKIPFLKQNLNILQVPFE